MLGDEIPVDELPAETIHAWHDHEWTAQEIAFAAEYLRTGSSARAHRKAFPENYQLSKAVKLSDSHVRATFSATKILQEGWMQGYIEVVRAEMLASMMVTKDNVLAELSKLAHSNMVNFYEIDEEGDPVIDLSGITHEQAAALTMLEITTTKDVKTKEETKKVKIRIAPKQSALELIGKHFKLFTDVIEDGTPSEIADIIADRRFKRKARAQADAVEDDDNDDEDDNADENG